MKRTSQVACAALIVASTQMLSLPVTADESPFGFSVQGRLILNGSTIHEPAGLDFEFTLWDAEVGGAQLGGTCTVDALAVRSGLFQTMIDFGAVTDAAPRWVQIRIDLDPGPGVNFVTLDPRRPLGRASQADFAELAEFAANGPDRDGVTGDYLFTGGDVDLIGHDLNGVDSIEAAYVDIDTNTGKLFDLRRSASSVEDWAMYLTASGGGGFGFYNETDDLYRLFLADSGNVGVGTITPSAKLHVGGSAIVDGSFSASSANLTGPLACDNISAPAIFSSAPNFVIQTDNDVVNISPFGSGGDLVIGNGSRGRLGVGMAAQARVSLLAIDNVTAGAWSDGNTWHDRCDASAKTDFTPVDREDLLNRLRALPITHWVYRADANRTAHLGPTAQGFKAAFGLGPSDTSIANIDANGIGLAAAQALLDCVDIQASRIEELEARLARIERLLGEQ